MVDNKNVELQPLRSRKKHLASQSSQRNPCTSAARIPGYCAEAGIVKRPSFQFYPGDWLNDAGLRLCTLGARGLWIEMLCLMHQGSDYGYLKVNHTPILPANLARIGGSTLPEVTGWLAELELAGVYSVDDAGCIFSRRMLKDENVRRARAAGGILGGNPQLINSSKGLSKVGNKVNLKSNLKPTPSSSSSSSSSNKHTQPDGFDAFWEKYPKKVGKPSALKAFKKVSDHLTAILEHLESVTGTDAWTKSGGQYVPNPATYLNDRRWEDGDTRTEPLRFV